MNTYKTTPAKCLLQKGEVPIYRTPFTPDFVQPVKTHYIYSSITNDFTGPLKNIPLFLVST